MGSNTVATIDGDSKLSAIFSRYLNSSDSDISRFVQSIPSNFDEAVDILVKSPLPETDEFIRSNRELLKKVITNFHAKARTLNEKITNQIDTLSDERMKIIVGIHQPNLFAFSGVFKKIVLLESLANHYKKKSYTIVPVFLIVDHDFMDDKWMHVAKLPSIRNSSGVLDLRYPINDSKRWKISSRTGPPTRSLINYWENQIYNWIKNNKNLSKSEVKALYDRFQKFWNIVEEAFLLSDNYSEFNSIIMSKIANNIWNYKTLFVNLSDLSRVFQRGYNFLLSENEIYLNSLEKSETYFKEQGIFTGVSANLNKHSPLWLHCDCGSKASSKISRKGNGEIVLIGKCISCKKNLSLSIGMNGKVSIPDNKIDMVSPRAIPILLLLSRELAISGYISGTGGSLGYTIVGKRVFDELQVKLPAMMLWAGNDVYTGFAQREASRYLKENEISDISEFLIEINQKNNELRKKIDPLISRRNEIFGNKDQLGSLLNNLFYYKQEQRKIKDIIKNVQKSKNALKLRPCIIDYAVNLGIEHIEQEWSNKLVDNNDLTKPLLLN
ncbi:MAG: bacillithiol biosynthesis BshC [Candidatus Nitrosocosmicus sp.]|nr:bacillithiol biosynthesis BshC [Candidatus Nitrosocosmicus sp.]MDN5866205.1 bacillithiol biosynthesis BshC [Candidatus Nitrosocosmicus sp.]